jgi:hypothetical protein
MSPHLRADQLYCQRFLNEAERGERRDPNVIIRP